MDRIFNLSESDCIEVSYDFNPGHYLGQGKMSPDGKFNFINIPKNASSEVSRVLFDWKQSNYCTINRLVNHLVILRDPTDRWISGMAEFLVGNYSFMGNCNADRSLEEIDILMDSKMFQTLMFNFAIFDSHTVPQCYFINGINISDITFFYFDNQVVFKLLSYIGYKAYNYNGNGSNKSSDNVKKTNIVNRLKSLLNDNPAYQHSIDKHYYADHKLFDRIKFQ